LQIGGGTPPGGVPASLNDPYTHYLRPDVIQAVADKLGMSVPELQSQIQGSRNLLDVARSRGVSRYELLQTVGSVGRPALTPKPPPAPTASSPPDTDDQHHLVDVKV
jgi:hypothetical protein